MDLSASLTGTKEFRIVRRGYDPDEVDAFLDQVALGVAELKRKAAEASDRAVAAAPVREEPSSSAEAEEIHRALILAQRAADEEVRKATAAGEALVAEARERAAEARREAEREMAEQREQGRAELLAEIAELEARRDALAADVAVLERHVDEQREVVQAALGELQSLLDHPEAFRVVPAHQVTGPAPAPAAPAIPSVPGRAGADEDGGGDDDEEGDTAAEPGPGPVGRGDEELDLGWAPRAGGDREGAVARPAPADDDGDDLGPPTEAIDPLAGPDDVEDVFLAELRKAMLDDEPLGPRDDLPGDGGSEAEPVVDELPMRPPRVRFGRRR